MSYNSSNQYSPYYQSQSNGYQSSSAVQQTNGNQYQDDSRLNNSYSNGTYQPLSAYQSDYQRQQQQDQAPSTLSGYSRGGPYPNQGYGNLPASTAEQNLSNSYTTTRPDTSALGNLAYASSLGQSSQPSLAQLIDYNRSRGSSNYSENASYGNSLGHERNGSGGQATYGNQQDAQAKNYTTSNQSYSNPSYQRTDPGLNSTGRSSPAQYQYSNPPQAQQAPYQLNSDSNQYSPQTDRAASTQSMPRPTSRTSHPNNQSPQLPPEQGSPYGQQNGASSTYGRPQSQSVQQVHRPSPSTTPATNKSLPKPATYTFARTSKASSQKPSNLGTGSSAAKGSASAQANNKRSSGARAQSIGRQEQQSPQMNPDAPTTVDPSQVFNNYEYQQRQSEFEAARKEVESSAKAADNAKRGGAKKAQPQSSPPADDVTQAARALMGQSTVSGADAPTKELFENEMKAMIEKMRDYKARNPGLFSQVWEEVKQVRSQASR